jgi:hypothetical protein
MDRRVRKNGFGEKGPSANVRADVENNAWRIRTEKFEQFKGIDVTFLEHRSGGSAELADAQSIGGGLSNPFGQEQWVV